MIRFLSRKKTPESAHSQRKEAYCVKAFIAAIIILCVIIGGICGYQVVVERYADRINESIDAALSSIYEEDLESTMAQIQSIQSQWEKMQNWLMAFNDHKDIAEMSRCITMAQAYGEFAQFENMTSELKTFYLLLNYSVDSSKPKLVNIL